ncbi:MAG: hypothetical protein Kow0077_24460 [Anaerolineae bacterium]
MPTPPQAKEHLWPRLLVLGGLLLIIAAMLLVKAQQASSDIQNELPQVQLQTALANGRPTVVFFHSLTCEPCIQMMETVNLIYPEFADQITLVDVNVSDTRNHSLLREQGIRLIPSLVYYDRQGRSEISYGVMAHSVFRQQLLELTSQ